MNYKIGDIVTARHNASARTGMIVTIFERDGFVKLDLNLPGYLGVTEVYAQDIIRLYPVTGNLFKYLYF